MATAAAFVRAARERGLRLFTGVPCSYLKPFIDYVIDSPDLRYVPAANEGDAVAIAAGSELGGAPGVVMLQNSGLGNAVNPLTSLTATFRIPLLLVPTLRGEPGGAPDEPQHELMGAITTRLLDLLEVPWELFPSDDRHVPAALDRATTHMREHRTPYALVMRKDTVEPHALAAVPEERPPRAPALPPAAAPFATRREVLELVRRHAGPADVLVATTGYTGRELAALGEDPRQLYVVGSMGCASSLGLGLALARPDVRVIVLDGDGAALMRLGAWSVIGYERPANLVHLVLDNGRHESTGGQATVSRSVDLCGVAAACGYPRVARPASLDQLALFLDGARGELAFAHVPIHRGTTRDLPRPTVRPPEVAERLRTHLASRARS